jgi:hypothetical protein
MGARLRPTFELETSAAPAQLLERVRQELQAPDAPLCGLVTSSRIELHAPPSRQHLWSPELRIEVHPEGTGSMLRGTYGPHPHAWTLFLAVYAGLAIGAFFAGTFALSQWLLHEPLTALYVLPVLLLLAGGAHALALVGQGLSKAQIVELRAFLDERLVELETPVSAPRHSGVRAAKPSDDASEPELRRRPALR